MSPTTEDGGNHRPTNIYRVASAWAGATLDMLNSVVLSSSGLDLESKDFIWLNCPPDSKWVSATNIPKI